MQKAHDGKDICCYKQWNIFYWESKKMLRNSGPAPSIVAHINEQDLQDARTETA